MSSTVTTQNVTGTASNIGFFYNGFVDHLLDNVQIGWYAQGSGMVNIPVTDVNIPNKTITINHIFVWGILLFHIISDICKCTLL